MIRAVGQPRAVPTSGRSDHIPAVQQVFDECIKSLGPVGSAAPQYVPPDRQPTPPFIQWPAPPK
jgi:hypothetical protein